MPDKSGSELWEQRCDGQGGQLLLTDLFNYGHVSLDDSVNGLHFEVADQHLWE